MLEQLAVAIFRLVNAQVNGTSPDIKVNPYTINLGKKEGAVMLDTESEEAITPGEAIIKRCGCDVVLSKSGGGMTIG